MSVSLPVVVANHPCPSKSLTRLLPLAVSALVRYFTIKQHHPEVACRRGRSRNACYAIRKYQWAPAHGPGTRFYAGSEDEASSCAFS